MKLYRIRRKSDGRFYRGKSKFTSHGTFFRLQQIKGNIRWVKSQNNELEIIVYDVSKSMNIDIEDTNFSEITKIIDRNNKLNDILGE